MNKVIMLIVVYNKKIEESATINSILASSAKNMDIIIHNNGPCCVTIDDKVKNKFIDKNLNVKLVNCIANKPLSILYNDFLSLNKSYDTYCLLDDDTEVNESFIAVLVNGNAEIILPKIISKVDSKIYYPIVDDKVCCEDGLIENCNVFSIGSGLIISRTVIDKFELHSLSLFDEHFALYGVDFSFFRRLMILKMKGETFEISSNASILHSLSKVENIQSKFRRQERLIDFVLTLRHYPTTRLYLAFVKRLLVELCFLRFEDVCLMVNTFFSGIHLRCKQWR